ncbi:MAG: immune inhibitor A [Candidatus Methanoperedens sp.]|nr:immune inhibitor A [Candidatus Methanoperedens sp.]
MADSNYTAILSIGQTPYQLGPFFRGGGNGWSWWDSNDFGTEKQKNLINLMILDKTTGKPVPELTSYPSWPQASFRKYGGSYSYKADTEPSPITTQTNYPDKTEIWMIKEVDLTLYSNANLTFMTWYAMETDWDYGYVAVSMDGNIWDNLPGTHTTTTNPNGNNLGNGITGSSGGWIQETMDLAPFAGNKILLGFRFTSDDYTNEEGWYVDDINVVSGTNIFSDDAETPARTLSVNVSYPHLTLLNPTDPLTTATTLQYTTHIQQVNLQEDINHPGTYLGYFKFDPFAEQYSGNYSVTLSTIINGSQVTANTHFQTTVLGCQSCHNKRQGGVETSLAHGDGGGMESCMFICHGGSRGFYGGSPPFMGPQLTANPMHVHEMQYGHSGGFLQGMYYPQPSYNVQSHVSAATCVQCHTSFLHDNAGTDTTSIGSYTLYGTNIDFSSGTHETLSCEYCHGSLAYPEIPPDQYQLQGSLGNYSPSFTSHESFTDTYIINVNGPDNLTITVTGDNTEQIVELYAIGPVDNTTTALQGPCGGNPCDIAQSFASPINMEIPYPYIGTWIVKVTEWQEGKINYTITSNYPLERKPIIKIPECNSCHKLNGDGNASTTDQIPDWNPGFAHADTNDDGTLDVQCRMCHDAMHNIVVKDCHDCHTAAPVNHPIEEPIFSQYNTTQCLDCHGDPHKITGGTNCIACHSPGDVNISNFGRHANISTMDGTGVVSNNDCWTCHYEKDMNRSNVHMCESCHNNSGIVPVDPSLIISNLMHGSTTECRTCHAPAKPPHVPAYHLNGTVGPLGLVESIFRKVI